MKSTDQSKSSKDPFNLERFLTAQSETYATAFSELKSGQKRSHWMWFIFPQIDGLGFSPTTKYYAIKSLEEARAYLKHPILGKRLIECAETVLGIEGRNASDIFGFPDDLKFRSSMTLFSLVSEPNSVFSRNLQKYFNGEGDPRTLQILEKFK